jgi:hypothetical protein
VHSDRGGQYANAELRNGKEINVSLWLAGEKKKKSAFGDYWF